MEDLLSAKHFLHVTLNELVLPHPGGKLNGPILQREELRLRRLDLLGHSHGSCKAGTDSRSHILSLPPENQSDPFHDLHLLLHLKNLLPCIPFSSAPLLTQRDKCLGLLFLRGCVVQMQEQDSGQEDSVLGPVSPGRSSDPSVPANLSALTSQVAIRPTRGNSPRCVQDIL